MADEEGLYKELERGKVLAIEVEADSRNELLARATTALSRIMVQPDNVKTADRQEIEIVDDTDVEMMHDMLGAALNVFRSGFIWCDAELEERGGPIVVWLSGERYDPDRHSLLTEIKGVQEHQLIVENKGGKWRTRIMDVCAEPATIPWHRSDIEHRERRCLCRDIGWPIRVDGGLPL